MLSLSKTLPLFFFASTSLFATTASIQPVANMPAPKPATKTPVSKTGKEIPCDSPEICSIGHGVTLSGSFLWWRATENLSSYAQVVTKENIINPEEGLGSPRGHNQPIHYKWDPGFNVRLGVDVDSDCWDLFADWTWYHNSTKNSITAITTGSNDPFSGLVGTMNAMGIYASWIPKWVPAHATDTFSGLPVQPLLAGPFAEAKVKWNLSYNTFNLELGKSFKTRTNLLRPFFGLRGALIERTVKVDYNHYHDSGSLLTPTPLLGAPFVLEGFDSASYKTNMHFWGLGPLLGVIDEFRLGAGFRLMGQFAAGFLYGRMHSYEQYSLRHFVGGAPSVFAGDKFTNHNQWSPATNLQMRLGINWSTCLNHQRNEFLIGAAWEQNIWFFHGMSANTDQGSMNLILGGLTATAQFKF